MYPKFPSFRKLTLDDREIYSHLVADYTPYSDISFTTLHIWWDLGQNLSFSVLNDNLVLNYTQPFDKQNAGLSLIGHHRVDESIETLLAYLKQNDRQPRLVHVPEFVVEKIDDKSRFLISEEPDMHEYIIDAKACAELEGPELGRIRRKVNRFLRETEGHRVELKPLDLSVEAERQRVLGAVQNWQKKFPKANDPGRTESQAINVSLRHHAALKLLNLCILIDDQLQGIALYHRSHDGKYYILNHLKADYTFPFIFDYLTNQVALRATKDDVPCLNVEMDLGIEGLRQHKMGLRPINFLKKYRITAK